MYICFYYVVSTWSPFCCCGPQDAGFVLSEDFAPRANLRTVSVDGTSISDQSMGLKRFLFCTIARSSTICRCKEFSSISNCTTLERQLAFNASRFANKSRCSSWRADRSATSFAPYRHAQCQHMNTQRCTVEVIT